MKKHILAILTALLCCISMNAQPPKVPSSIKFAGETISFDRPDLYERMDRELITFTYMHTNTTLMLKRADRIFKQVVPILKANGIPEDLKYLMAIESNLDPEARSVAGACGLWQFMTAAGRENGLEVNANVDERYNIAKATEAACKYLKTAYAKFGNWMTVAASYNGGIGGMETKLANQHQDNALDLWLVSETSRYMFRILVCKMLFENPESFGFNVTESYKYKAPRETVTVTDPIPDLVKFAEDHGTTYARLKEANLWLRESKLNNASHRSYKILIP